MNQTGYYGPTPDVVTRPTGLRNRIMIGAGAVTVLAFIAFFVSLTFFSTTPGTCDAWIGCRASEREQWSWTAQPWTILAVSAAAFTAWWAYGWRFFGDRPKVRKVASIICVVVAVPVVLLSLFAAVVLLDCSNGSWFCGPELSAFAASPALVAGTLATGLIAGLRLKDPTMRRRVSTTALLIVSGTFVACLAGTIAGLVVEAF